MKRTTRKQGLPAQQRRRGHRRQRLFHMVGRILFLGVLLAAAVLALTVFFKVETISVEGAARYTPEEIVAGLDVKQGDNLYLWNKVKVSEELLTEFPYLESVQIRRHLPNALIVTVTECRPAVAAASEGGFTYVSKQGKVLERAVTDGGLPTVTGVPIETQPGQMIRPAEDAYTDALLEVWQTLVAGGMLDEMRFINLQDLTDVRIGLEGRFDIRIGTLDVLAHRLRFAKAVIDERLSPSDVGRLYWDQQNRMHYVPDTVENVAKSATGANNASSPLVSEQDLEQAGGTDKAEKDTDGGEAGAEEAGTQEDGTNPEEDGAGAEP